MNASNSTDKVELAELWMLINKRKVADIRKYNMERIEQAVKNGGRLKIDIKRLGIGKIQMYALMDKAWNVTTNVKKASNVAEEI